MALTSEEETKVKAIIAAFDGAKQVSDLPAADMTATDKQIEVYDKKRVLRSRCRSKTL